MGESYLVICGFAGDYAPTGARWAISSVWHGLGCCPAASLRSMSMRSIAKGSGTPELADLHAATQTTDSAITRISSDMVVVFFARTVAGATFTVGGVVLAARQEARHPGGFYSSIAPPVRRRCCRKVKDGSAARWAR
jgi:hypothetical protein